MNLDLPQTRARSRPTDRLHSADGYEPVLSSPGLNALFSEFVLGGHFGPLGMVCGVEGDHWTAYLPERALAVMAEEGYRDSADPMFVERYLEDANRLTHDFKALLHQHADIESRTIGALTVGLRAVARWYAAFLEGYGQADFFRFSSVDIELQGWAKDPALLSQLLAEGPLPAGLPARIAQLARLMRDVQMIKWVLRGSYNEAYVKLFLPLTALIGHRTQRTDIECLTLGEVEAVARGQHVAPASSRRQGMVVDWEGGIRMRTGAQAQPLLRQLGPGVLGSELTGMVASPGRVQGRVRLIPVTADVARHLVKMAKGEVLVAATTGPEMMVAIQKASAIVTDEGGLMSHAAVVSRELKIPCVVGTKYATRLFQDGDSIDVDAQRGVVRKLA
jgi:phosphohistidine swiveling domain-containing protein